MRAVQLAHLRAFLAALHPCVSAEALVEFRALPHNRRRDEVVDFWLWDADGSALDRAIDLASQQYDVYIGVNPRRTMAGGRRENIAAVTAIPIDVDKRKTGVNPEAIFKFLRDVLKLPPSLTVWSGGGAHFYLLLDRPYDVDAGAAVASRVLDAVPWTDPAVKAPTQIMRLPGTWNWKTTPPEPCWLMDIVDRRYSLEEVTAALDAAGAPDLGAIGETEIDVPPVVTESVDVETLIAALPARLAETVRTGRPPSGVDDMSRLDWSIMRALVSVGATDDQIIDIYQRYPVSGIKAARAGQAYFARTLDRARADVLADLADESVAASLLSSGLFVDRGGLIVPDKAEIMQRLRTAAGLDAKRGGDLPLQQLPPRDLFSDQPVN